MLDGPGGQQNATLAEILDDHWVRVLHEHPTDERGSEIGESPVVADGLEDRPSLGSADGEVLRSEGRRHVDDPGSLLHGDEVPGDHPVRVLDVRVRRRVANADEVGTRQRPDDRAGVAEDGVAKRFPDDQPFPVALDHEVRRRRVNGCPLVRRERPRRRRPHDKRRTDERRVVRSDDREPDEDARVGDRLVALGHLCVREGGAAPRAVRRDLVVLDQEPAEVELLQRPPDRLDVRGVHRPVRLIGVDPEADPLGESLERADVPLDGLAAEPVELGDTERLDVLLPGRADLLLDLDLDRQAVAIPSALPFHVVARHRLESREHVLEGARLDVMDAGLGIRGRRALVEDPPRRAFPGDERAMEDVGLLPEGEDVLLEVGEAHLRVHGFERHVDSSVRTKRLVLRARTRRWPRGTTSRCRALTGSAALRPRTRPSAITGGPACVYCGARPFRARFGQGLGEDVHRGRGAGSHRPGSLRPHRPGYSFPSSPVLADATRPRQRAAPR